MNVSVMIEYVGAILIFIGSLFAVVSAIGNIRFPDVYTRSHAATKSSTLGVLLTLTGALIYILESQNYFSVRLVLGIVFVFLTAPVSGHLVTRAAYRSKVKLADITLEDDLEEVIHGEKEELEEDNTN
ncbi:MULTISPECIES: Na+/H+ antiporter subunit G [Oceanobacillus]|uniref:Na+/H+ antiporter subunit G n=1 Tax=Oceanobacillus indicireducens TaxID=1004261 RepID=A0A917XS61_9BACI|nr:Na+/H+ antiporter subunit G [Oceanobacillus indicireducens]GGN50640.1 Na+/H+ antiporter subunit G [Oceanobacillus indicireducens]